MSKNVVITGLGLCLPVALDYTACLAAIKEKPQASSGRFSRPAYASHPLGLIDRQQLESRITLQSIFNHDHICRMVLETVRQCLDGMKESALLEETGIISGSWFGSLDANTDYLKSLATEGPRQLDPELFPLTSHNYPVSLAAIEYGLKGPVTSLVFSETAGFQALAYGLRLIRSGRARRLIITAFDELCETNYGLWKTRWPLAEEISDFRPGQPDSKGTLLYEGCGGMMIEEQETALSRGACIRGEIMACPGGFAAKSGDWQERVRPLLNRLLASLSPAQRKDTLFVPRACGIPAQDMLESGLWAGMDPETVPGGGILLKKWLGHCPGGSGLIEAVLALSCLNDHELAARLLAESSGTTRSGGYRYTALLSFDYPGSFAGVLLGSRNHALAKES